VLCANIFYGADKNPWLNSAANVAMWATGLLAVVGLGITILAHQRHHDLWAFIGTGASMVLLFTMTFIKMYGTLGLISPDPNAFNFTVAASSQRTLRIMTIATACVLPIVLAYTAWTYWVFRNRISTKEIPEETAESQIDVSTAGA
jgi:cytochrome d ubiquinol oxidase subunit II